jgi:heptosyltransferase-2
MTDPLAAPAVLVVGPAWVGDMVMAQSLFRLLKQRDPVPQLHVLAPVWTLPLLKRMPEVDRSIEMPVGRGRLGLGQRLRLGRQLRSPGYGQAILLPNSWKSALVPWWARIPRRTGWLGEQRYGLLNDFRRLDPQALPMTVQRFVALGLPADSPPPEQIPLPRLRIEAVRAQQALQALGLEKRARHPLLALCPGAEYGPAKRWPAAHFGRLARSMRQAGWDVWLFGSANDREVCEAVNAAAGGVCTDLAGRTDLGQAVDLLSLAERVVSNDSGLMHVAGALGHPLVALFGSSDPNHTPPLSRRARVLSLHLGCSPCFRRVCPLGHTDCLNKLTPERVVEALAFDATAERG